MKNRISHLINDVPEPQGPFSDAESETLLHAYHRDPSDVPCPKCGPDQIEVLAFIEPSIDDEGYANVVPPVGEYAAALFCHSCRRAVGILAGDALPS